ncbi:hypothetical protein FOMPIDRAFT_1020298 [Fomitopsis schrenkii]|uniref:Uncharacterized protein n=1 Tax=Fomitopsis schrenkii TaxID=2126942 RepID=S8DMT2_FOMSC|nr:hypothetical protein FOMPIDRAFT_1020298 [Fomitopsis schrenkii]
MRSFEELLNDTLGCLYLLGLFSVMLLCSGWYLALTRLDDAADTASRALDTGKTMVDLVCGWNIIVSKHGNAFSLLDKIPVILPGEFAASALTSPRSAAQLISFNGSVPDLGIHLDTDKVPYLYVTTSCYLHTIWKLTLSHEAVEPTPLLAFIHASTSPFGDWIIRSDYMVAKLVNYAITRGIVTSICELIARYYAVFAIHTTPVFSLLTVCSHFGLSTLEVTKMPVVQSGGSEVSTSVLQLQYYRESRPRARTTGHQGDPGGGVEGVLGRVGPCVRFSIELSQYGDGRYPVLASHTPQRGVLGPSGPAASLHSSAAMRSTIATYLPMSGLTTCFILPGQKPSGHTSVTASDGPVIRMPLRPEPLLCGLLLWSLRCPGPTVNQCEPMRGRAHIRVSRTVDLSMLKGSDHTKLPAVLTDSFSLMTGIEQLLNGTLGCLCLVGLFSVMFLDTGKTMVDLAVGPSYRKRTGVWLISIAPQCGWDIILLNHGDAYSLLDRIPAILPGEFAASVRTENRHVETSHRVTFLTVQHHLYRSMLYTNTAAATATAATYTPYGNQSNRSRYWPLVMLPPFLLASGSFIATIQVQTAENIFDAFPKAKIAGTLRPASDSMVTKLVNYAITRGIVTSLWHLYLKRRTPTNAQRLTPPQFLIDYHNKTLWFLLCYIPASTLYVNSMLAIYLPQRITCCILLELKYTFSSPPVAVPEPPGYWMCGVSHEGYA